MAEGAGHRNRQVISVDGTEVRIEDGKVFVNGKETPAAQVKMTSKRGNEVRVENGQVLVNGKPLHAWVASHASASASEDCAQNVTGPSSRSARAVRRRAWPMLSLPLFEARDR